MKTLSVEEISNVSGGNALAVVAAGVAVVALAVNMLANADKIGAFVDGFVDGYNGN